MCNAPGSIYIYIYIYAVQKSSGKNGSNSFERTCKTATEAFVQKCANLTKMLKSAESRLFRHSARIIR